LPGSRHHPNDLAGSFTPPLGSTTLTARWEQRYRYRARPTAFTSSSRGELDERALRAFTEGQCHGFALALHRRKQWPLVAIDDADGSCVHICARDSDDRLVDIRGFHPAGEMPIGNGRTLREVDEAYLPIAPPGHG
jgi:hypothetical protein